MAGREIVIGVSGATSLLEALASVLRRGIVVTADPMYYIYCNFLERLGWEILPVPEDGDGLRTDLLAEKLKALGPRAGDVRFFYAGTVNNPTGTVMSARRRVELRQIAEGLSWEHGRKVPVIFDKAYEELIHDPSVAAAPSAMIGDEMRLVYEISTVSKILAPGLRIGYMVAPAGPLSRVIVQRVSDIGFSAPPINQVIAAYMLDHHIAEQVRSNRLQFVAQASRQLDRPFAPGLRFRKKLPVGEAARDPGGVGIQINVDPTKCGCLPEP